MASTISPNMSLIIPTVGAEQGPQYAFDVNSSLTLIDQHDHSPGRGVQVTPAGMNINQTLNFNSNSAINLAFVGFTAFGAPNTFLQSLSVATSSTVNELFYTDNNGASTQITKNGVVNAAASSIPGESYNAGTFIWVQGNGSTTPANFDIGSITLRPNIAGTTNGIILGPPTISSLYNVTLPTLPSSTAIMTMTPAGAMMTNQPLVRVPTPSASCGTFILPSTSGQVPVTNLSVTITTIGRPVLIALIPPPASLSYIGFSSPNSATTGEETPGAVISIFRGATLVSQNELNLTAFPGTTVSVVQSKISLGSMTFIDLPGSGTYTYTVQADAVSGATLTMLNCQLLVYELA